MVLYTFWTSPDVLTFNEMLNFFSTTTDGNMSTLTLPLTETPAASLSHNQALPPHCPPLRSASSGTSSTNESSGSCGHCYKTMQNTHFFDAGYRDQPGQQENPRLLSCGGSTCSSSVESVLAAASQTPEYGLFLFGNSFYSLL